MMNIGILGTGHIGGTLGKKWAAAGHVVQFGSRDPNKATTQDLIDSFGEKASVASILDAINFGDVVLFAIPGKAMDETISANAKILAGKIIIDAANNIGAPVVNSLPTFAAQVPTAKVYRAFNIYGWENFEDSTFSNGPADLFYCGTDGETRPTMEKLITDVGLNPLYVGGPEQADVVDSLLKLWFTLVSSQKTGRHLAFKVLR